MTKDTNLHQLGPIDPIACNGSYILPGGDEGMINCFVVFA